MKQNELVKCELLSVDFESEVIEIKVPFKIIDKGFNAGYVLIDFSNVQKKVEAECSNQN
jgi:hypothetical protein